MWQIVPFYYLFLWPLLLLPIYFRALGSFVSSCPLIAHFYVAPTKPPPCSSFYRDLARAIALYPRPRKKLSQWIPWVSRCDCEVFRSCRRDFDNAVSLHEQPWWACCDRVERLQPFRMITNSDRDDFRKAHNAIAIEPAICARNRDTLPRIARAIAMYFREWDREAHKKRPRCAVFCKLQLRWIACEPRKWSHFWGIKFGDLGVGYTVWAAFRDAAAERQLLPWSSLRRLRWMGGTVGIATGSSDALSQQTQSTKTSN